MVNLFGLLLGTSNLSLIGIIPGLCRGNDVTMLKKPRISAGSNFRGPQVNLFWQRANYFLVLNSGIVLAIFDVTKPIHVRVFAAMGILASLFWFWACLASKYWQTFWTERLGDFERK